jgi:hypothetical protein
MRLLGGGCELRYTFVLLLAVLFAHFARIENVSHIRLLNSIDQSVPQQQRLLINKRNANSSASSSSAYSKKDAIMNAIKQNNHRVSALVGKSITLTCSIDLDDKNFSKSENYKVAFNYFIY